MGGLVLLLHIAVYFSFLFMLSAFIVKAIIYARMPLHLRWELYPVAHQVGREYGGSCKGNTRKGQSNASSKSPLSPLYKRGEL